MSKPRFQKMFSDNQVYEQVRSAVDIVAETSGLDAEKSQDILRALVKGGYYIAPREPTNAMLLGYIESYGELPINPRTIITAIGKARKRWKAMGELGTGMALSLKFSEEAKQKKLKIIDDITKGGVKAYRENDA